VELCAAGAPGLESVLALELTRLGLRPPRLSVADPAAGGRVEFEGDARALARACLFLRTADRVLVRAGGFNASDFASLRRGAARLPWERFLAPGRPVRVKADCRRSKLYHEGAVAERLAEGIGDRLGRPCALSKDERAPLVLVRAAGDAFVVEIDAAGEPLSRRGYRLASGKAPLKETLAAALVLASGWDRRGTLLDPFCGSGTIAIEAALMAAGTAASRRFACEDWPGADASAFARERASAAAPSSPFPGILASDRDAGAVRAARANAERAGVADRIEFSVRAVSDAAAPPGPGWLVTNPPYGVRVSEGKDLRALYARLGSVARGLGPDWTVALLSANPALSRATGLSFDPGLPTLNGGLKVRVVVARPR
jgi:putative N6-adenine-specific DNA methylase